MEISMEISTKPYMLRAIHEWCVDSGFTPYIAVKVDAYTKVPMQFVSNGQIVLNISYDATGGLLIKNDAITFKARFGGVSRDIYIPVDNVIAIYASENGQGMAFDITKKDANLKQPPDKDPDPPKKDGPPTLTRVK